jgi:hypothetical protein
MRTLTLTHKGFDEPLRTETVPLSVEDFDRVWSVVTAKNLLDFAPEEEPGEVFDYDTDTLRTETQDKHGDSVRVREHLWSRPLLNQARLSPLIVALARLARDRGKTVRLERFVP